MCVDAATGMCVRVRCWMVSWRCPVLRRAGRLSVVDDDVEAHVEGGSEKNGCAIINLYVKSLDRNSTSLTRIL